MSAVAHSAEVEAPAPAARPASRGREHLASGLFILLPKFLEPWVVIWPVFHLNQVALGAAGVSEYTLHRPQIAAAVLVGVTVLFGGAAVLRLARRG